MLNEALDGFDRENLEIAPMTLSFVDAQDPLDFARQPISFKTPEATLCPTP